MSLEILNFPMSYASLLGPLPRGSTAALSRTRRGVLQHRVSRSREAEPGRDARQRMAARAWLAALFEDIARRTKLEVRGLMMPLS